MGGGGVRYGSNAGSSAESHECTFTFRGVPAYLLQILLLTIRIMDDVKDYDKDVVVHPDRYVHVHVHNILLPSALV